MKRVYVNEAACIGCRLCEVYCRVAHSKSKDIIRFKKETPRPPARLRVEGKEEISFSVRCQHCDDAPCVQSCLTGALSQDPASGAVTLDEERCIGCWTCILVCPFGAVKQDAELHRMVKCDLCAGEEEPACVSHCPNEALAYEEVKH